MGQVTGPFLDSASHPGNGGEPGSLNSLWRSVHGSERIFRLVIWPGFHQSRARWQIFLTLLVFIAAFE